MKRKEWKYLGILFLGTLLICVCYFLPYLIDNVPLTYGTDLKPQWFEFYTEFERLMRNFFTNKSLPFYSWSLFLGNNFFASKSYYLMGDIYSYLGLLFNGNFFDKIMILDCFKFFVSSFSMYFFLKALNIKPLTRIMGALAYSFSAWAVFFSGQLSFLSFYSLMPLYFLSIESYFKKKSKIPFILMVALLLFTNFYFFYTISILTVIYFSYRYFIIHGNFVKFWKTAFELIGYYFMGVLCTGVLTLPTIYYILQNDRLGEMKYFLTFDQLRIYLHNLVAVFVPNYLYIYRDNVFETGWHVTRELCIWASGLVGLCCVQIVGYKDKLFRKATLIVYSILLIILFVPILNSIVHGFGDPSLRWTLFFIFFNIMVFATIFDNLSLVSIKIMKNSLYIIGLLLLLIIPLIGLIDGETISGIFTLYSKQMILFGASIVFIIIYGYLLIKKPKWFQQITLVVLILELSLFGSVLLTSKIGENEADTFSFIQQVTHVLEDKPNELNNYLDSIEPVNPQEYYRIFVPHDELYWSYSHNMSLIYNINGLMTYDSTYAPSFNVMKKWAPKVRDFESEWIFNIKDNDILTFLNTKYALVLNEDQLPKDGDWRLITDDYRGFISIYRNDNYRPLGTSYAKLMNFDEFNLTGNSMDLLSEYVISNNEEISNYLGNKNAVLENINYGNNSLTGVVHSSDDSFMILTLPYDEGWKILINGQEVEKFDVNGGFIGFKIFEGENALEMYFVPQGFKLGFILSGCGIFLTVLIIFSNQIMKKRKN